jgi:hypothetical protein
MVCLFVCLFVCLNTVILLAQEQAAPTVEIYFSTEGVPDNMTTPFVLQFNSKSIVYDKLNPTNGIFPITANYSYGSYQAPAGNTWYGGWDAVFSQYTAEPVPDIFAYALYKFTLTNNGKYFYIDFRDNRFKSDSYSPVNNHHHVDIWIKYNFPQNKFYFSSVGFYSNFTGINDGDYFTIWAIKEQGTTQTDQFENYWSNCLSIIPRPHPTDGYPYPFIVWGPIPNYSATGYKIYRRIHPDEQQFSLLAQLNNSSFTYSDLSLTVAGNYNKTAIYKINAYNEFSESQYTNEANINISLYPAKHGIDSNDIILNNTDISYLQNYPNPFNPATTIMYSLTSPNFVKIIITNTLGQNLVTLVESYQSEGLHSVNFHAFGLPSGIYFYTLRSSGTSITKKMSLLQ